MTEPLRHPCNTYNFMYSLNIFEPYSLQRPTHEFSCSHQIGSPPRSRLLNQLIPLSPAWAAPHLIFHPNFLLLWQPVELFKQVNHTHLWEAWSTQLSSYHRVCLPQPLLVHSIPLCNTHVALHDLQDLCSPKCKYTWLINSCQSHLSSDGCHMFNHHST